MENVLDILSKYKTKGVRIGLDTSGKNLSIKGNVSVLDTSDKVLLGENKDRLISFLSDQLSVDLPRSKIHEGDRLELAPNQKGIWLHEHLEGSDTLYLIPSVYELHIVDLDKDRLTKAAEAFVEAQKVLSFVFGQADGVPFQELKKTPITQHFFFEDLSNSSDPEQALQHYVDASMQEGFDLEQQAPWSITVFDFGKDVYHFFVKVHHLIADGTTLNLLVEGLIEAYRTLESGAQYEYKGVGYHDYVQWLVSKENHKRSTHFWKSYLADREADFSFVHMPKVENAASIPTQSLELNKDFTKQITQFTKAHNIATTHLFTFAFGLVLSKYGRTNDLILGTPAEGRTHKDLNKVIGDLVNTIPVRLKLDYTKSITDNLKTFGNGFLQVLNHQMYPFEYILEDIDYQREADRFPLFNTMVSFPNNQTLGSREKDTLSVNRTQALYDSTLSVLQHEDATELHLEYDTEKFSSKLALNLLKQTERVLGQIVTEPSKNLAKIRLLSEKQRDQKQQAIAAISETRYPTVLEAFMDQASDKIEQTAVFEKNITHSYTELKAMAEAIAGKLQAQGAQPQDRILVALESSAELIASMLGIWMMGGIYVPVGTELPKTRLQEIEQDSEAKITIDKSFVQNAEGNLVGLYNSLPSDVAYILYTSGSTGKPKGVVISQGALMHKMEEEAALLQLKNIKTISLTSPTFDVSLLELVFPLTQAGSIVIDSETINQTIHQYGVNILQGTPTYFAHFESELDPQEAISLDQTLEVICIGGESLNDGLVQRLKKKLPSVRINNHYGPTEITIDALVKENVESFTQNSIGKPLARTGAIILDDHGNILPEFTPGELCIIGPSLAEGYWKLEEESAEKFTYNQTLNTRVYKTGDLAVWSDNGEVHFIGRKDNQIKFRGFRIELEEINARLRSIAGITNAFTAVLNNVLVAWVATDSLNSEDIQNALSATLPQYMIPTVYQQIAKMPMTTNGKVDEKQLPQPETLEGEYVAPRTATEEQLAIIWQEVLDIDQVGIYDNFFEQGGHSLRLLKLQSLLGQEFGTINLQELSRSKNLKSMAALIETISDPIEEFQKVDLQADYPVLEVQEEIWHASQNEEGSLAYTMPFDFQVDGAYIENEIRAAYKVIIERNELLRTVFFMNDAGEVRQRILEIEDACFNCEIVEDHSKKEPSILDIDNGKQISLRVHEVGEHWFLQFRVHHIVADAHSLELLQSQFIHALEHPLTAIPKAILQHKDLVSRLQEKAKGMQTKSAQPSYTRLPSHGSGQQWKTFTGKVKYIRLDASSLRKIVENSSEQLLTFSVLTTLWKGLLFRYTQEQTITIGTMVSARNHPVYEDQIGPYFRTLPSSLEIDASDSFKVLLRKEKERQRALLAEADLAQSTQQGKGDSISIFASEKRVDDTVNLAEIPLSNEHASAQLKFDLSILHYYNSDDHILELAYNDTLYGAEMIDQLVAHFQTLVRSVSEDPDASISELLLVPIEEQNRLLELGTGDTYYRPNCITVLSRFKEEVKAKGKSIAIKTGDKAYTFNELDTLSTAFAGYLETRNIKENSIIGLELPRGFELIVAIFGVLKKGCAYVPVDRSHPQKRKQYILENSEAALHISIREMQSFMDDVKKEDYSFRPCEVSPEQTAYVIYTSGTTGQPKGVAVTHDNLLNFMANAYEELSLKKATCFAATTNYSFDISVLELVGGISFGITTVVFTDEEQQDPFLLMSRLRNESVDYFQLTPSRYQQLQHVGPLPNTLNYMLIGGEAVPPNMYDQLKELDQQVIQVYGPTETTIWSSSMTVNVAEELHIGKALSGESIYVLDDNLNIMPVGIPGELYISGSGVAKGYKGNEPLSNEKFLKDPFKKDTRMYRTGDFGYFDSNGKLKFKGRKDSQVKWKGNRIEMGEIISALDNCPFVATGTALLVTKNGQQELIAYVVAEDEKEAEIREFLTDYLPQNMVPSAFCFLDKMPLNLSGKVDVNALKELKSLSKTQFVAPKTEHEKTVAAIWCDVLSVKEVSLHDSYFTLGGSSMNAVLLVRKMREQFDINIGIHDVYMHSRLNQLSDWVKNQPSIKKRKQNTATLQANNASSVIWKIISEQPEINDAYAFKFGFQLKTKVPVEKAAEVVHQFTLKHSLSRASLHQHGTELKYTIQASGNITETHLNEVDELDSMIGDQITIVPNKGEALFQFTLCICKKECIGILVNSHAILLDGWSLSILSKDLVELFQSPETRTLPLPSSALLQEAESTYWSEKLKDRKLRISYENVREVSRSTTKGIVGVPESIQISGREAMALKDRIRELQVSDFSFFLSVIIQALHVFTKNSEFAVCTTFFGRDAVENQTHLGLLANTVPIVSEKDPEETADTYIKRMFPIHLEAMKNQQSFGTKHLELENWKGSKGAHKYFDANFVWNFEEIGTTSEPPYQMKFDSKMFSRHDFFFNGRKTVDGYVLNVLFDAELINEITRKNLITTINNLITNGNKRSNAI